MSDSTWDKEDIYDEMVAPLMAEILLICKENRIPMFAHFQCTSGNDETLPLWCTSMLIHQVPGEDRDTLVSLEAVARRGWKATPPFMAMTVTTKRGNDER